MEAPLLSLILVLGGPLVACWHCGAGAVVALLLAVAALVGGEAAGTVLSAAAEAIALGAFLSGLARRAGPGPAALAGLALALLPVWLPPACARLAGPGSGVPGAAWALWPGGLLAGPDWDPLRQGPFYESWGSRTAAVEPSLLLHLAVLGLLAALLYCRRPSRSGEAGSDGANRP